MDDDRLPANDEATVASTDGNQGATNAVDPQPPSSSPALEQTKDLDRGEQQPARLIGPYKLRQKLGEGGMGEVWLAEQTQPVKRRVALKLIKPGMGSDDTVARFEAERQALAMMSHPGIAQVLDAGTANDGRPYFVMELVQGVPFNHFCDSNRLSINERLLLFVEVCHAVQHAHQKGVIHRDLKPSNVLVTQLDGKSIPKVIDFGLAKAIQPNLLTDKSLFTAYGQVVGTLQYMSPEQAESNQLDIDTRTDIYSLGVMLYETLTGTTPVTPESLRERAILQVLQTIRDQEPPRPSDRLSSTTRESVTKISAQRNIDPAKLRSMMRGELDWIVMKSLEKDRNRRYETANGFARDIQRLLANEVVEARPPTAAYRLQKFVRRNRVQVVAAFLLLLSLIGGVVGTTVGLEAARAQRDQAEQNLITAEENYQLARQAVDQLLVQVGDSQLLNEPYMDTLRQSLLTAARDFYVEFAKRRADDPQAAEALADGYAKLAEIDWTLGVHDRAIENLRKGRSLIESIPRSPSGELSFLGMSVSLSSYLSQQGKTEFALQAIDRALGEIEQASERSPADPQIGNLLARALERRGAICRKLGQNDAAIQDFQRAETILLELEKKEPEVEEHPRDLSNIYTHRGQLAYQAGHNQEAEEWERKALDLRKRALQNNPTSTEAMLGFTVAVSNLAGPLRRNGKMDEAVELSQLGIETLRNLNEQHPGVASYQARLANSLVNHAILMLVLGKLDEADRARGEAVEVYGNVTRRHPEIVEYSMGLAAAEAGQGDSFLAREQWSQAIDWYRRSLATVEPLLAGVDPRIAHSLIRNDHWGIADAFRAQENYSESIKAYQSALEFAEPDQHSELNMALALAMVLSGDYQAAIKKVEEEFGNKSVKNFVYMDGAKVLVTAAEAIKKQQGLAAEADATESDSGDRSEIPEAAEPVLQAAIDALRKADERGYFKNPQRALEELSTPTFETLKHRDDFKQLLDELQQRIKPTSL